MKKLSDYVHTLKAFLKSLILHKVKKKVEKDCRRLSYSFSAMDQPDALLQLLSVHITRLRPYNLRLIRRKESIGYLVLFPKHLQPPLDTLDFSMLQKIKKCVLTKYFAGKMTYRELRKHMTQYSIANDMEISFSVMDQFDATDFTCTYAEEFISSMSNLYYLVDEPETSVYEVTPNTCVILPYIKGRVYRKIPVLPNGFVIQGFEPRKVGVEFRLRYIPVTLALFK